MNKTEQTLDAIFNASDVNPEITNAKVYGLTSNEDGVFAKLLDHSPDVYSLLEDLSYDRTFTNYQYISLVTTGWAAPLNKDGDIDCPPSEHNERQRVTLVVCVDVYDKSIMGSVIDFEDENMDRVYDMNNATGQLADAINSLFED